MLEGKLYASPKTGKAQFYARKLRTFPTSLNHAQTQSIRKCFSAKADHRLGRRLLRWNFLFANFCFLGDSRNQGGRCCGRRLAGPVAPPLDLESRWRIVLRLKAVPYFARRNS